MGYCMEMREAEFFISNEDAKKAFPIVKEALLVERANRTYHFSWVDDDELKDADCLCDILDAFRWEPSLDKDGNITSICFCGEKLGCDKDLFDIIAPFVKEDSYIQMYGECGCIWRWVFDDGKCIEKEANISFE